MTEDQDKCADCGHDTALHRGTRPNAWCMARNGVDICQCIGFLAAQQIVRNEVTESQTLKRSL